MKNALVTLPAIILFYGRLIAVFSLILLVELKLYIYSN